MSDRPHRFPVTVYYEDTDMGGIVYHANYLRYVERARSDWVRRIGIDQVGMRETGQAFAVRRIVSDFLGTARLDDRLVVETVPSRTSGARMTLAQKITRGERTIFRAEVELVLIDMANGTPRRLPLTLREAVERDLPPAA
ncbi:acyl-CoA thioester hydrolase [Palleronia aestuarii]|uniref:Acyl-CoA thioester hydrolase n=1 Tax=Palleronia aestuarii TaxID=568105 RepID=A0A2W7NIG7_9RHOB|nr:tol-pal system-associated acyl-CoA thioesterase [Palleronia aestuarii]PZX19660.1 acyl-CoA thioester hydrolase [Palleronia aestuarii]